MRIGRATALGAGLGVVGFDQIDQWLSRHNGLHLAEKPHASGALPDRGLLVITKPKLLAAHEPSPFIPAITQVCSREKAGFSRVSLAPGPPYYGG